MKKIYLFIAMIIAFACTKHEDLSDSTSHLGESPTSFATVEELDSYLNDNDIVYYQISRAIAAANMEVNSRYRELHLSGDCSLSERPVIIYGFDNRPLTYDFIILDNNNNEVGTVSSPARKNSHTSVQSYRNSVDNYAKLLKNNSTHNRIYSDRYSNRYVGTPSPSGTTTRIAVSTRGGQIESNLSYESDEDILARITSPDYMKMMGDSVTVDSLTLQYNRHIEKNLTYWKAVDYIIDSIGYVPESFNTKSLGSNSLNSSDFEKLELSTRIDAHDTPYYGDIIDFSDGSNKEEEEPAEEAMNYRPDPHANIYKVNQLDDRYYLNEYEVYSNANRENGACGAWVAQAIISVNNRDDYNKDNSYLNHYSVNFWSIIYPDAHPLTIENIDMALEIETNLTADVSTWNCSDWDVYWHIIQKGLPCLRLMCTGNSDTLATWHWWLVYGSRREVRGWWIFTSTDYYHLIIDNGWTIPQDEEHKGKYYKNYKSSEWFDTYYKVWY